MDVKKSSEIQWELSIFLWCVRQRVSKSKPHQDEQETFKSKAIKITAREFLGARQRSTLAAVRPLDQTIVLMFPH